ncbi:MAG: hypothetical protein QXQ79_00105 [Candidatus Nanoarchaeia archaeon]
MKFTFSKKEIIHLFCAAMVISLAFELVLFRDQIFTYAFTITSFAVFFLQTLLIITLAFVLHELGHKFIAQKIGIWAEFRAWPFGLVLALILALISKGGFVFAAPGAVLIVPAKKTKKGFIFKKLTKKQVGHIGIIGVLINLFLATIAFILALLGVALAALMAQINTWLAIFNLIPVSILDGAKVWHWSKTAWAITFFYAISLFILIILI